TADALELGLDARHRPAPVAMHDEAVHAVRSELLGGGEAEAARSAQDHGPLVGRKPHAADRVPSARSADRTSVIEPAATPMALKNPRSGRPGPTSTMRVGWAVSAAMLLRQRTVALICRTRRMRRFASSPSWNPPVRFEVTHRALAASQPALVDSSTAAKAGSTGIIMGERNGALTSSATTRSGGPTLSARRHSAVCTSSAS